MLNFAGTDCKSALTGNPIKAWVPKKFRAETSVFVGITKEKALNEVAYARYNLTPANWVAPINGTSNTWEGLSSEGVKIKMYIDTQTNIQPLSVPNSNIRYGSAFPNR